MILGLAIWFLIISIITSIRIIIGPTITDRLVAADSIGIFMSIILLLLGIYYNISLLIDIVLAYAVLLFVDVLIFAKYFEYRELYK